MKKTSITILSLIFFFTFSTHSSANPFSRLLSFFQSDLVINVRYKTTGNLAQGSKVYLADAPREKGLQIGEVSKVSTIDPETFKIEVRIDNKYKEQLNSATSFVLINPLFSTQSNAYIVVISSTSTSKEPALESGDTVEGVTFLEYQMTVASRQFKTAIRGLINQNAAILKQLEGYLNTLNIDSFQNKINELIGEISKFSATQKDTFKNEFLPKLKEMADSLQKQLEAQNKSEKSKELKQQLQHLETLIDT